MTSTSPIPTFAHPALVAGLTLVLASCGSGVGNAGPRVSAVPKQAASGGTTFQVDLAGYVSDPEGDAISFAVVAGGGSFTGSTYSHVFPTLGSYTVEFSATDGAKTSQGSFVVDVTSANLAAVRVDASSLRILDTDTETFVTVSSGTETDSFAAGLEGGELVFERTVGDDTDLLAFDLFARKPRTLGAKDACDETFVATLPSGQVVFQATTATDSGLFLWNPATGLVRTISDVGGEHDRNALVGPDGTVFFERTAGGQADIYAYDADLDETTAISTHANAESLQAVLPNGGVVFTRVGGSGETDLFYHHPNTGLVEIAGGVASMQDLSKSYAGHGSQSQVVFSVTTASGVDLAVFVPGDPTVTTVTGSTSNETNTLAGVTGDDRLVFVSTDTVKGGTDLWVCPLATLVSTAFPNPADHTLEFRAAVTDNGVAYVVYSVSTAPATLRVYNTGDGSVDSLAAAGDLEFAAALSTGDFVYQRTDGTAIFTFDPDGAASTTIDTGAGLAWAGAGADDGDFAYHETNADADLFLYDASAASSVAVSDVAGEDAFQSMTAAGAVLFTRVVVGNSNADLFVWDPAGGEVRRLTDFEQTDPQGFGSFHDFAVQGVWTATR